jgi:hypothetical protein
MVFVTQVVGCEADFLNNQQSRWLSLTDEIYGLKTHELRLVPLVHPSSKGISQ